MSLLPELGLIPTLPQKGSVAELALYELLRRDLSASDWKNAGRGSNLSGAVKVLEKLGWEPESHRVQCKCCRRLETVFSLPNKVKRLAQTMTQQDGDASHCYCGGPGGHPGMKPQCLSCIRFARIKEQISYRASSSSTLTVPR
jgi:hypothetical protein